jgi:hypothetical protein
MRRHWLLGLTIGLMLTSGLNAEDLNLTVRLQQDGYDMQNIVDNGEGDLDSTVGVVEVAEYMYGDFLFSAIWAESNSTKPDGSNVATLTLQSFNARLFQGDSVATLDIYTSDKNFSEPIGDVVFSTDVDQVAFLSSDSANRLDIYSYLGTELFDTTNGPSSISFTGDGSGVSNEVAATTSAETGFSLTTHASVTLGQLSAVYFDLSTNAVFANQPGVAQQPVPPTLALVITFVTVFGVGAWLSARRKAKTVMAG